MRNQQPDKNEFPRSRSMGEHGGNRGRAEENKTMRDGRPASRQSHGADPHRGEKTTDTSA